MAITLQRLCEKASYLYGLRVLAGAPGMNGPVQWVHVVEDAEAAEFLHGGDFIFKGNRGPRDVGGIDLQ